MTPIARAWATAVVLAFAAALNYADRAALSSVLPPLRAELGLSDFQLGALGSFFLWSYAAGSPLAGMLADRVSRSRMIVVSILSWSVVCAATGLAQNYTQLAISRVFLGLAECLYLPAATALLADHHSTRTRGTAMSVHSVGLNLGVITGGTLAGHLGDKYGWRPGFVVLGLVGVVIAMVAAFVLRDADRGGKPKPASLPLGESIGKLVRIPSYMLLLSKVILAAVGIWIFLNWLPLYYRENFGMTLAQAGFAGTFLLQASATTGIALGGPWSDRLARRATRHRMLLQCVAYILAAPFLMLFLGNPGLIAVAVAVAGFSLWRGVGQSNENPMMCDVVEPRLRSTAIGFLNTGACFAGGIGVAVAGALKPVVGLSGIFATVSVLFVVSSALLWIGWRFFLARDIERQLATSSASR